ncbi:TOBE domain-containing protein [Cupriavidus sp. CV2]|uniref:TOBE domain-containing protein n=1 Tax=Cupriavidus ulmosensis TaxID=3065913 RepID=UPI00296AF609|nr:TOBE domain-containing protein [Cupriavidus sp. CV2]MDW3685429.1 TOBE domain-containing protein [Cupriavidus sp. CV2]
MKTSARNQLSGKVSAVHKGAVNDEIELEIASGVRIVATITAESTKRLGLAVGKEAVALIKASSVIVGVPDPDILLSARNQLAGTVAGIKIGAVNAEVSIGLPQGGEIVAIITNDSVTSLGLVQGGPAVAIFKAASVLLAARA